MNKFINEYFSFSRKERNGIVILLSILLVLIASSYILPYVMERESKDMLLFKQQLIALHSGERNKTRVSAAAIYSEVEPVSHQLFNFNPNRLSVSDWRKLGLSDYQIAMIKKFEEKGGRFNRKEDLKKIYAIKAGDYQRLEPYIMIGQKATAEYEQEPSPGKMNNAVLININSADSNQLVMLNGIGPAYAKRIIKYRDRLGGFIMKEQLKEVYGVDSILFEKIAPKIQIDRQNVKKIDLNSVTFDQLKKHPYMNYNLANALINYRTQHGAFQDMEELHQIVLMTDDAFARLREYITIGK